MSRYKAIIFDFGGVITTSPLIAINGFADHAGIPQPLLGTILGAHDGAWSRWERGECSEDEFVTAFEAEGREHGLEIDGRIFLEHFFAGMTPREEMVAVAVALRPHFKVACITNNVQQPARGRNPLFDQLFDVVVESSVVGMRKPDPRIYLHTCEQLGVEPYETVFLDDFGVNLKAARELGMTTIRVDHSHSALKELEQVLEMPLLPAT